FDRALLLAALLLAACFVASRAPLARADSPIKVTTPPAAQSHFPDEIVFSVSAQGSAPITDAVLHYTLLPATLSVLARGEFDKGTSIQAQYHMRSNGNPLYLPPGKEIRYTWELTDANGVTLMTDPAKITYADPRFQWHALTAGNLTLSYYRGTDADAKNLLNVGRTAVDKAAQLEGVQPDFPIKLFAYANSQDFLPAAQKESKSTDPGLLGQAQEPDTVIFVAGSLQGSETEDTARHELTHLVTGAAVKGGLSDLLPLWLNEGISVNAQTDPGGFGPALQQAIANDSVVPIQVLESSRGIDVGLFYGESWGLVKFLIQTGGPPKFAQLLATIKGGKGIDQALQTVYSYDRTGLYNAWRDSVHLSGSGRAPGVQQGAAPARGAVLSTPDSSQADAASTPFNGPAPRRGGDQTNTAANDNGTKVLLLTLGGALMLMLLAAVVGLGVVLARRSRI
ncbi:MAG: peptidase MA family metallohydrolase, partial [Dehalococcoidia bacterium]